MRTTHNPTPEEHAEAVAHLRDLLPRGSTVHLVLRHRNRTNDRRTIALFAIRDNEPLWVTWSAAVVLRDRWDNDHGEGIKVSGGGVDTGWWLVSRLAHALYGDDRALRHHWL